jgi:hypothetical protein
MSIPDEVKLEVVLRTQSHTIADTRTVVDALDGLVMAGVWGALAAPEPNSEDILSVKRILERNRRTSKAGSRFFPGFPGTLALELERNGSADDRPHEFAPYDYFDPVDPMDAGVRDGLNSYLRRLILQEDAELYSRVFSFAQITKAEHHSPLLIELSLVLGILAVPVVLTVGLAKAAVSARKAEAEADIRETEAQIRKEELSQKRLQTIILKHVESAARELKPDQVPKEAITAASHVSTTAISDLGSKPLIGTVSVGITTKS